MAQVSIVKKTSILAVIAVALSAASTVSAQGPAPSPDAGAAFSLPTSGVLDKAQLLDIVTKSAKHVIGANVVIHMKASKNDDESTQIDSILHGVDAILGYITKEVPKGKL
ncbi:hypothetical protein L2E82_51066 [Cichorium intybus]|nr:hypothetical protein L2E82_51066 [Cichorium intybus]